MFQKDFFHNLIQSLKTNIALKSAVKITLIYFSVGCLWILLSDKLVEFLFVRSSSIVIASMAKGWFYVLATSVLIFQLIYPAFVRVIHANQELLQTNKKLSESNQQHVYLNYHDTLTGLYNRTYFQEAQRRFDTPEFLPLSVIVGDINGLKLINDALGHEAGDRLLIAISDILRTCCRDTDSVARTGGDEFMILLPRTDQGQVHEVVKCIKTTCLAYAQERERDACFADISLGYATKEGSEESFLKIIMLAEDYMYQRKLLESKSLHSSIISSIRTTLFEKSNETEAHAMRIGKLACQLGQKLNLSEDQLVMLELLSTLHDIGKIGIDLEILTKTSPLTDLDWRQIKRHPEIGFRITQASPELRQISDLILCHHERWDGQGYPQGLSGEQIPLLARIISVVDSYDAMTEDRTYRKAFPQHQAMEIIRQNIGTQFDPVIAQVFLDNVL